MFADDIRKTLKASQRRITLAGLFSFLRGARRNSGVVVLLGQGGARMLVVRKGKVVAAESVPMDSDIMAKNEIKDVDAAAFFVRQHTKKFPGIDRAIGVIPEEEIFRRFLQVERAHDPKRAVAAMLGQVLPLPVEEMFWEWRVVPSLEKNVSHQDVEIVAIPRQFGINYFNAIYGAQLEPLAFLPESLVLGKLLFPDLSSPNANIVIFSDHHRTTLFAFAGRAVHVTSVLEIGEEKLASSGTQLVEEVERIRKFYRHRIVHEHGASPEIDRILVFGNMPDAVRNIIAFNTQIRPEVFDVSVAGIATEFIPLVGAAKFLLK